MPSLTEWRCCEAGAATGVLTLPLGLLEVLLEPMGVPAGVLQDAKSADPHRTGHLPKETPTRPDSHLRQVKLRRAQGGSDAEQFV